MLTAMPQVLRPTGPNPFDRYRHIVVEGPIGAGKTTLCRRLADLYSAQTVLEEPESNPFLARFYKAAVAKTRQVAAGVARRQAGCRCCLTGSLLAIVQRLEKRQSRQVGQAVKEARAGERVQPCHLRHGANDRPFPPSEERKRRRVTDDVLVTRRDVRKPASQCCRHVTLPCEVDGFVGLRRSIARLPVSK